jgi:hypothetical protein
MDEFISKEALLRLIETMPSSPTTERENRLINAFITTVKNFPAADVRPVVRGKWRLGGYGQISDASVKWYDEFLTGGFLYCSVCKERSSRKSNFCPNCGAEMEKS